MASFADDTRLLKCVKELVHTFQFQRNLNSVYRRTHKNNMQLNGKKFEHLHYSALNKDKEMSVHLNHEGRLISCKNEVKDLGVIMRSTDGA